MASVGSLPCSQEPFLGSYPSRINPIHTIPFFSKIPPPSAKAASSPLQIICGGDYIEYYFLVCDAAFQRNAPPLSSECKSKPSKQNERGYIPEDGTHHHNHQSRASKLLIRIRKGLVSNLGQVTGYAVKFHDFPQSF
jgi:hypothetical protein